MEGSEEAKALQKECVKVAVNIRPLISAELLVGCTDCVSVVPGEPQVQVGSHAFTYDHVYGSSGSSSSLIFEECVAPLIDALFRGYNATVLAYGQTGSGKTYTMGTNYNGESNCGGIIPKVMDTIFRKVESTKDTSEFLIRVSFIEIFKEEVFDLLDPQSHAVLRTDGVPLTKAGGLSRAPIQIRETPNGGITLAGVMEAEVRSKEEMASYLARGSLCRATGSTNMNSQSSRSHAIFTICIEQKKIVSASSNGANNQVGDDIFFSKFHLVDLAGSERAKRTGADGLRLKEGIHINRGLLALGNVISALGDDKKRKEGGHVPYRDSKLTRLLQDSLGGNSKTLMIACISPADSNAEETINTLKYANRARNIQNKAVINRDPMAAEMQRMRGQLEQLQAELLFCRGGGSSAEELQVLRHKITLLEARNDELHHELKEKKVACDRFRQSALDAQVEKDKLILKIESARCGKSWDEIDELDKTQDMGLIKGYISKIQELEAELLQAQSFSIPCRNDFMDRLALEDISSGETEVEEEEEEKEKEREHSTLQDRLDKELQELDKRLEQKEAEMKQFSKDDTSVLKQHYEKKLLELEHEKKLLQKEIEDLRYNLSSISSTSDESAQKLKEDYLLKLNMLETQVSELKKKQEAQSQLLRQKQKSDEASRRLQEEILKIKSQKVQLQNKIKQESEQFRSWKASREKEVLQLKKEGRKNEYEMHKLLALNQRQKMVLQRKTEEAAQATKRLKELLEAKKSHRDASGLSNANGPGIQALIQAIEHELEVILRVHEVRSEYEQQMQERAAMAKEVAKLKEESEMFKQKMRDCPQTMSPSARNSRIVALENMLRTSSSTLVSMASQLSEAEERERVFSGRGRWNQIRSLADAKNLMNHLFNLASSARCQSRDMEVSCREKDSLISELKEKVVRLNSVVRQLEIQLNESRNQNLQVLFANKSGKESATSLEANISRAGDINSYDLRKGSRPSQSFNQGVNNMEDMDISDSEMSDAFESDADPLYEYESDLTDHEYESRKKAAKRHSKATFMKKSITLDNCAAESSEQEKSTSEMEMADQCCTCSKFSLCKTKRCECRAAGGTCGALCGCVPSKCNNRGGSSTGNDVGEVSGTDGLESSGSRSSLDQADDEITEMVSHGTMLLQSAMTEVKAPGNNEDQPRKALSDIGNTMADQNASKTNRRKKWRKSTIQLVPSGPPQSSVQPNNESSRNREEIPLRLPRALDSVVSDSNPPLTVRNSVRPEEPINSNKDSRGVVPSRSPLRPRKPSNEKENHRL